MKEKLQEYALMAEIISAVAIVISLVFVGLQIQQTSEETALNTAAIKADSYQALVGQVLTLNSDVYNNPQLAELVSRISNGGEFGSVAEELQYSQYITFMLEHGDMAYYQFKIGNIEQARLENTLGILSQFARTPYFHQNWEPLFKQRINPEFASYIEENML
jgi:hypothetical protein